MKEVEKPQILSKLPFEHYVRLPFANSSQLTTLREKSPAHLKWQRDHASKVTPALKIGTAIHCALLEPEEYERRYVEAPDAKLNTKAGKEALAAWLASDPDWTEEGLPEPLPHLSLMATVEHLHPKVVLTASEARTVNRVAAGARESRAAKSLLGAPKDFEDTVIWQDTDTDTPCKGRIDAHYNSKRGAVVLDIKSAADASPYAWSKEIANRLYHIQAAFYTDGFRTVTQAPEALFLHLVYEKEPPYAVAVHQMPTDALEMGRREYKRLLRLWKHCVEKDEWGDYSDRILKTGLPGWYKEYNPEEQEAF